MVPPPRRQALIGIAAAFALLVLAGVLLRAHAGAPGAGGGFGRSGAGAGAGASFSRGSGGSARSGAGSSTAGAGGGSAAGSAGGGGAGGTVLVDVAGAVRHPGVYELRDGDRVIDALARAGGVLPGAQVAAVNRAARLVDGQQLLVPATVSAGGGAGGVPTGGAGGAAQSPQAPVSINTADAAALDALQGIGPTTAQKIVDDRAANGPFRSIDDLDRVPGIGPTTIASLRDRVTL